MKEIDEDNISKFSFYVTLKLLKGQSLMILRLHRYYEGFEPKMKIQFPKRNTAHGLEY